MIQIPLTSATDGMTGIPLPYLLHSDPMVTCIMFLCMLLVSVVFAHGKKHFLQGLKNFVRGRERGSMFDEVTASDLRHTIVLVFHTCLMLAFGVYRYLAQSAPALFEQYSHLGKPGNRRLEYTRDGAGGTASDKQHHHLLLHLEETSKI